MTPEQIIACSRDELAALFPDRDPSKVRKRAQNAIWQRKYRAEGRDPGKPRNFWLGHLDGPPIGHCVLEERQIRDAQQGSAMLLQAIVQAGLRA